MFDAYVMVDWSAAKVPRTGRDSIWVCWHDRAGERLVNPPTRHQAKALLADWLADPMACGQRVLIGFDFPFGYPAGFAARLGLSGPPWRAVWEEIARLVSDDEHNANNRFDVAAAMNERISGAKFPFWGCPVRPARNCLGPKHHRGHEQNNLAERRLIDEYMRTAQPCWKLLGAGSVGGQILTGIPAVRALRDDPRWRNSARVWPFETGLRTPADGALIIAEVYPSLWSVSPGAGETKDAAQVRTVARHFAGLDRDGALAALFDGDPALTLEQRQRVYCGSSERTAAAAALHCDVIDIVAECRERRLGFGRANKAHRKAEDEGRLRGSRRNDLKKAVQRGRRVAYSHDCAREVWAPQFDRRGRAGRAGLRFHTRQGADHLVAGR